MSDIIKLLSDSVANQIAAGEVVQRPSSVVKELVENSLDAGATNIDVIIKDAGRTLIQVVDNGFGMSPTDARMSFERHATSKISKAEDLFAITTMGFRGEALASIAAVAEVELVTRRADDELGTCINIAASKVKSQEPVAAAVGTNFKVRNLFFNIPARRKFLKSDKVEYKHIIDEIHRIVLTNPAVSFKVVFDDEVKYQLFAENVHQRIANVFGKKLNQNLVPIGVETQIVNIKGFIAKPEMSQKNTSEQFFFVNNRYMYHPYFRKAVTSAYDKLLPEGENPRFFIYLEVDPATIDINIHPTKTEIKFEGEQAIYMILNSAVKEALGKFNIVPSLSFEDDITRDVHLTSTTVVRPPVISVNPDFNPFKYTDPGYKRDVPKNWEQMYERSNSKTRDDFDLPESENPQSDEYMQSVQSHIQYGSEENYSGDSKQKYLQLKNKYILTSSHSGMIVINQRRAHERIMYEHFMRMLETRSGVMQKSLFPLMFEPSPEERGLLIEVMTELNTIGFDIVMVGNDKFEIRGVPAELAEMDVNAIIRQLLDELSDGSPDVKLLLNDKIAISLAKSAAMTSGVSLKDEEMEDLFFRLMSCSNHNYTADGRKIMEIVDISEIESKFN
ncbi:MAG: DNA mismatch repair endonuclease MutL [Bacteroidales bacterium]|nr:DNA mismatch repair endonuclease MutL [Bacteroidales bacterium]